MNRRVLWVSLSLLLCACETERAYVGPELTSDDLALIVGAPQVTSGVPIKAVIRKVDDRVMRFGYSKVLVLPGSHQLLVDCVMANHAAVRFPLTLNARRGHRYVLRAQSAVGNRTCGDVVVDEL
jgi:hypothetical protein